MRPVNLLPDEYRPRQATGETKGGAYILLGVLGTLLVMALGFALVTNQVNSRKTEIAKAKTEADQAEAKTRSEGSFADFRQVKEQREQSVKLLASGRFDWERVLREVALVMPKGMWLIDMTASASGDTSAAGTGGAPTPSGGTPPGSAGSQPSAGAPGSQQSGTGSPSVKLTGCAEAQDDVATLMVRMRKLYRATDVKLGESTEEEDTGSTGATGGSGGSTAAGSESCGTRRFKFDVTVTFSAAPPPTSDTKGVPAALGGGS
jgi:Tfp pilus assembly protein PilN